ncbi:hypothetical protein FRC17_007270 [Serendipita sp. 399]|nr:hypothetical protein FRC17_007270 [Serendipita sp. 399]
MSKRNRAHSQAASGNSKAQLIAAYNELGKELSDTRMRVIGNYNIGRVIGEGSYGKVRLGAHRLTGTRVALKQIPKSVSAQLTREIHHHRQLHHSNIVQLYEVIATETSIWLVTELCAGGELFDYLVEKGRIDEYEARLLFGQLCLAVAYCHDQGVVHRDLKLENVLLDDHTQIKLSDFGFTREFERGALLETFCGTTGYASPEMLQGQKYLGQEVDIWSLGIILYTLLVGALPFDDDDEEETKRKILAGNYEIPEWISPEARELIEGILVQEPLKRLSLQQILSSSWFLKRISAMSPPLSQSLLPSVIAEQSDIERQSSDMPQTNVLTTSTSTRPSTPPNQTEDISDQDARRPKSFERDSSASPSRPRIDRRNSAQSIIPPLPTRTPVRTKRRSVSSAISPSNSPKQRPSSALFSATEQPDFISAMTQQTAVVFSTPQERAILSSLAALGFDTGQIVHSVLNNACDSAGALWWILRKKVGETFMAPEEPNGPNQAVIDPFSDSTLNNKSRTQGLALDGVEQGQGIATNGDRPTVFLEEVGAAKKKKRHQDAAVPPVEPQPTRSAKAALSSPPPDFSIVPATPIAAEEPSKSQGRSSPTRNLSPTRVSTSTSVIYSDTHGGTPPVSTPNGSKIYSNKARSSSISMLQRATTVLGGAAGLVRKKSEDGSLTNTASTGNRDRSNEEPRSSSGSGGRLTKSPPPGKISREAKERERQNSSEGVSIGRSASTSVPAPSTYPGHVKSKSSQNRRAVTEGGRSPSPVVTRDGGKTRNRVSILNTFRGLFDEGWRRKHKIGPNGTPSNSPAGVVLISPQGSSQSGYFGPDRPNSTLPDRPYTPRKRGSVSKGTTRRGHRSHKDKRPSISSRRSSSINSRRSSVASMASLAKQGGTLGSVGEYTVYNGSPLTRKISDNSRQSLGTKTPLEEDAFEPSRPGSAISYSQSAPMATGIGKRGKRHSKSSSTSSAGSLGRHAAAGPPSRSGTTSPLPTGHAHRRVGSGSSQTRVVKQYVKKSSSIGKSLEATTENTILEQKDAKRVRSGSVSSTRSAESSVLEADGEFGGRRATSPLGRSVRSVMVAQKKTSTYGSPSNSLGLTGGRSSWKKSWGQEPPGWAHRTRQEVIVEILDSRQNKGGIRDVFAQGGKSGVPPGTSLPDDEDDWSDIEDDTGFAGGLGQLNSAHNLSSTNTPGPNNNLMTDSPLMIFSNSKAGRRTNRNPIAMSQLNKSGNSPTQMTINSPINPSVQSIVSPTVGMESVSSERNPSRRQLPGARSNFGGAAIVEEEEEEE